MTVYRACGSQLSSCHCHVACGVLNSIALAGWFVHRLREAASACPNVTLRQGTVKRLLNGEAAVVL